MYVSIFQGSSQMHAAKMDIGGKATKLEAQPATGQQCIKLRLCGISPLFFAGKLYMFRVLERLSCWCLQEIGTEILYHHKKRGEWEVAYT